MQFPGEKYFPLSDVDKSKVIDIIEVADSESGFSLHENALVSEICAFYLNKNDIHFIILRIVEQKSRLIEVYSLILFKEIAKCMSLLFE